MPRSGDTAGITAPCAARGRCWEQGLGWGDVLDPGAPSRGVRTGFAGGGPSLGQVPAEGAEVVPRPQKPLERLDVAFPGFESCW